MKTFYFYKTLQGLSVDDFPCDDIGYDAIITFDDCGYEVSHNVDERISVIFDENDDVEIIIGRERVVISNPYEDD